MDGEKKEKGSDCPGSSLPASEIYDRGGENLSQVGWEWLKLESKPEA